MIKQLEEETKYALSPLGVTLLMTLEKWMKAEMGINKHSYSLLSRFLGTPKQLTL
jgi:hypothetical protein